MQPMSNNSSSYRFTYGQRFSVFSLGMTLAKHKETILRERDRLNGEVEELNKRLQLQRIYCDEMDRKRTESEHKNKELYKLLDVRILRL